MQGTARRALLRERGRPMTLRRQGSPASPVVSVLGYSRAYQPGELQAGVQQGDVRIEILADEILAAAWPAPPRQPDRLTFDGRTFTVQGSTAIYDAAECIGYSLWCRGG